MVSETPLEVVMSRLRTGDQDAANLIFHRFAQRLTALASRQFDNRLRSKTDPEDVVQSVYKSFFRRDGHDPFALSDWDSLWSLLATITVRKCLDQRSYWFAARRNVGREGGFADDSPHGFWTLIDHGPTPYQATVLTEILETILAELSPTHRQIAEVSFQGYPVIEVADRCGCSERTVARVVARIKDQLWQFADPN